jgi:hypothetical protein
LAESEKVSTTHDLANGYLHTGSYALNGLARLPDFHYTGYEDKNGPQLALLCVRGRRSRGKQKRKKLADFDRFLTNHKH